MSALLISQMMFILRKKYWNGETRAKWYCIKGTISPHKSNHIYKKIVMGACTQVDVSNSILRKRMPSPEVIKLFSCSTQLSIKFILSINVIMPTILHL